MLGLRIAIGATLALCFAPAAHAQTDELVDDMDALDDEELASTEDEVASPLEDEELTVDDEAEEALAVTRAKRLQWRLGLETGGEFDSNLHRVEVIDGQDTIIDSGALLRSGARYQLGYQPDRRQQWNLDLRGASKLFTVAEGQSENVAVVFGDGRYTRALGSGRRLLSLRASYYDAINIRPFGEGVRPVVGRSFRSSDLEAAVSVHNAGRGRLSLLGAYSDFVYKPDADFDWRGPSLGLRYSYQHWLGDPDREGAASLDIQTQYRATLRDYQGAAFRNTCAEDEMIGPECFVPSGDARSDLAHNLSVEAIYTGQRIYSLLYAAQLVDSNSYGQASLRQRVELGMTTRLPGDIYATGKIVLRLNTFLDPLLLARDVQSQSFVSIDDENRNSAALHLARDLGSHWGLEARLAIFSNEFATKELRFRRETAYFGALYRFGN